MYYQLSLCYKFGKVAGRIHSYYSSTHVTDDKICMHAMTKPSVLKEALVMSLIITSCGLLCSGFLFN